MNHILARLDELSAVGPAWAAQIWPFQPCPDTVVPPSPYLSRSGQPAVKTGGRSSSIRGMIFRNRSLGTATSAIWNVT